MGSFSIWHWLIVLVVVVLLFGGKGKVSSIMKDVGIGVNQFRKGLKEGGDEEAKAQIKDDSADADKS
ncbi:MAG: twin-arginine translocase TatA/TatE family subunit [Alphaproteobacteria bacterium]|nr:twin-arginine translocase TatA/TatE family subunit [Alphaproteobacteria bacterium]MDA7983346.1 twin-arginine translocase TatA/TatE family subunit [Alphaproteobacteria bacterium]MDA7983998.1 twin-arginine translocase TatA/TatE family subunit [Alphaproteobacteria bacterium]MDA7986916.1 twin-arginine translocase TatA/TatE family subunit [Alphaproteobacteria bacterium]MDA7988304.1 twin-arginine translocase TatA/TatE family subunit [Alphaproteobacteria bacterium]